MSTRNFSLSAVFELKDTEAKYKFIRDMIHVATEDRSWVKSVISTLNVCLGNLDKTSLLNGFTSQVRMEDSPQETEDVSRQDVRIALYACLKDWHETPSLFHAIIQGYADLGKKYPKEIRPRIFIPLCVAICKTNSEENRLVIVEAMRDLLLACPAELSSISGFLRGLFHAGVMNSSNGIRLIETIEEIYTQNPTEKDNVLSVLDEISKEKEGNFEISIAIMKAEAKINGLSPDACTDPNGLGKMLGTYIQYTQTLENNVEPENAGEFENHLGKCVYCKILYHKAHIEDIAAIEQLPASRLSM